MGLSLNLEPLIIERLALLLLMVISFSLFFFLIFRKIKLILLGRKENRFENLPERIKTFFLNVFIHRLVLRDFYPGFVHFVFFWAFTTLTIGYINLIAGSLTGGFYPLGHGTLFSYYSFLRDLMGVLTLIGVAFAFLRRYVISPRGLENSLSANVILILVFLVVSVGLMDDSFRLILTSDTASGPFPNLVTAPLSVFFSSFNFSQSTYFFLYKFFWWLHFVIIFGFLVYIPLSKHLHLFACPFNEFFVKLVPKGAISYLDIENSETYGISKINEFSWKALLDFFACAECGRCERKCPASLSGKALSPRKIIKNLRDYFSRVGPSLIKDKNKSIDSFIDKVITSEEIWDCTTCRACQEFCPVLIEHIDKLIEMRRNLVLVESRFPQEVKLYFKNLENNFNPWGIGSSTRADWAKDLGLKVLSEEDKDCKLLYWVGCAGAFDDRNKKVSGSVVKILKQTGLDFAILGAAEKCCGESARRIGNEYLFQMLAQENIENIKKHNIKKILTGCPHCFNTFRNEYCQFGDTKIDVVHSSVFIADLIKSGKIKFSKDLNLTLTFHDSCYLGRYNNIYEPPREILRSLPGVKLREMKSVKADGFCCGAGGGRMWMEDVKGEKIYRLRTKEVLDSKAGAVGLACPYCITMLEDGLKEKEKEDIKVLDLAELVAMAV